MIITGTTTQGYEFSIDSEKVKDYRFIKSLAKAMGEDVAPGEKLEAMFKLVETLLGDKEDEFIDYIASKNNGNANTDVVGSEVGEMVKALKEDTETKK